MEHPCVLNLYKELEKHGYKVDYIGVDSSGDLDVQELTSKVDKDTALVSIMYANNETGAIFPVKEVADIVKDINPKGIGALYVKSGTMIAPLIVGGHQERGKRAGTENVPYIVGMAKAAELAMENLDDELCRVKKLRDTLEDGILSKIKNARLNATAKNRVPNTTNIGFLYIEGELILLHLNDAGICASSGSACTSGSLEPSHVLRAMGVPFTSLHGSIRFSLSRYTTEEDINYTVQTLPHIIEKLAKISPFQKELGEILNH